jgi:hypothetical protein
MTSSQAMSSSLSLGQWISEKLSWDNFLLWRVQVVPIACDAQLFGYLDDTIAESEKIASTHTSWAAQDQQVLGSSTCLSLKR